jgi:GNAT superfamily N-acetyltransferase
MSVDLNTICRLKRTQVTPAVAMLDRAFKDYSLNAGLFSDASGEEGKTPSSFLPLIRYGLKFGEVYATSSNLEGVAVWLPSDKVKRTLWRKIRSGDFSMFSLRAKKMRSRLAAFLEYSNSVHRRWAPFPHLYLQLLGVDPVHQGKGYGSVLMKFMFERIDKSRLPCYLETHAAENVPIYERHGFRVVEEGTVPGSQVKAWAMLRETPL